MCVNNQIPSGIRPDSKSFRTDQKLKVRLPIGWNFILGIGFPHNTFVWNVILSEDLSAGNGQPPRRTVWSNQIVR